MLLFVPRDAWVAEICQLKVEYGVSAVPCPCAPIISAVGDILRLARTVWRVAGPRVNRHHAHSFGITKPAGIVFVYDNAASKGHYAILFGDSDGKFFPVEHVRTYGVAPTHVAPLIAERIVLVEEMVFAMEEDESV